MEENFFNCTLYLVLKNVFAGFHCTLKVSSLQLLFRFFETCKCKTVNFFDSTIRLLGFSCQFCLDFHYLMTSELLSRTRDLKATVSVRRSVGLSVRLTLLFSHFWAFQGLKSLYLSTPLPKSSLPLPKSLLPLPNRPRQEQSCIRPC